MSESNIHAKHRLRMKERYRKEGLDGFSDHEVLELLLFFALPYKNTNDIAHELINRFGSLSGVLEADYKDLIKVDGIAENAATCLTLMPDLFKRYSLDKQMNDSTFKNMDDIYEYLLNSFIGSVRERVDILLFDAAMRMISHLNICEGTFEHSSLNAERIAEMVFSNNGTNFILVHNHPSGDSTPSDTDLIITREIYKAFLPFKKYMIGHVIVAGDECRNILDTALGTVIGDQEMVLSRR